MLLVCVVTMEAFVGENLAAVVTTASLLLLVVLWAAYKLLGGQEEEKFANDVEVIDESDTILTMEEVAKHDTLRDLWLVIDGKVYDATDFVREHPGGMGALNDNAGTDVTVKFYGPHHEGGRPFETLASLPCKGYIPELVEKYQREKDSK